MMPRSLFTGCLIGFFCLSGNAHAQASEAARWNPKAAADYLDERFTWWMNWPASARDHETFCISCHTVAPYALGRGALRGALGERSPSPNEQKLLENVTKRVRMWKEVEPFYPDQLRGLPKTSESRGTESILDALILVWNDAPSGKLGADARLARSPVRRQGLLERRHVVDEFRGSQFRDGEAS